MRSKTHRLIRHQDGYVELYDHRSAAGETQNVASEQMGVVAVMTLELESRLKLKR